MNRFLLGFASVVALLSFVGFSSYNSIISKDEQARQAWGDLESTLQRRLDLIPNLVQSVKGYSFHESDTLQKVVEARAKATSIKIDSPETLQQFQQANNQLSNNLSRLLAVAENYPDLKASESFRDLMTQLEGTENRINVARQNYNNAIADYNFTLRRFPNFLINSYFLNLQAKTTFVADEGAKSAPKVDFGK